VADQGEVRMGYENDATQVVFTAMVDALDDTIHGFTRIQAVNSGALLSRLRINQSYEQQGAGDIVSDLAGQAGVETDKVESGTDLPFYVIDDRRSAWDHIALLAQKSGFCAYFTTENKLYFGPLATGQAVQTFTYGIDILAFESTQAAGPSTAYKVVGEGAAGSDGDEAWSWLVKDPASMTAEAGDGDGQTVVALPALRSAEAVQSAADGLAAAAQRRLNTGRMITAGAPAVTVGSTIEMADLPKDALNGPCLAMRVSHEYSKRHGFVSRIDFCKPKANGMGGVL
jgi:phage protein D